MKNNMAKRRYTDEERANALAALAANGGCVEATAKLLGIPETTLRHWAKGERHPEAANMGEKKKEPLSNVFENIAYLCLEQVTKKKLSKAGAVDLLKTAGIAVDKMRLLRDQPTEIKRHSFEEMSDDELDSEIARLEEEIRGTAGGESAPGAEPPVEAVQGAADPGVPQ